MAAFVRGVSDVGQALDRAAESARVGIMVDTPRALARRGQGRALGAEVVPLRRLRHGAAAAADVPHEVPHGAARTPINQSPWSGHRQ